MLKAFKTGPVRLNLSKGGLGLSAGITGARVGINSRGTYVHGGSHGLYYRKSPVIITVENPLVLAARIEKVLKEKMGQ